MHNILITGGAGSVGRELALTLAAAGHAVRVLDLPQCDFGAFDGVARVEVLKGGIEDAALLRRAAAGVDSVIHLAALLPPASERDRATTWAVNVRGTQNVLEALAGQGAPAHVIFSSSVCVYGDTSREAPPILAARPPQPVDLYGESKAAAEALVRAAGLPYTILRISGVAVPAFLAPPAVWPFMPEQRIEYICRADVARALARCVGNVAAQGKTLNVAGGPTWQMRGREYVARINELLGLEPHDAAYLDRPGAFDWYDTAESQALLDYQCTPFEDFARLLRGAIEAALGGG